jgi:opacity protein-like surface antigen
MKKVLAFTALLIASATIAQNVTQDASGNYRAATVSYSAHDSTTTKTFTDTDGTVYPVFVGRKGGIYVWKQNSEGIRKKYYLHTKK